MSRPRDPHRKPALLADVVEYLLDKPLASMTFRTVADGLGVSAYTLVYHFGSRADLVREVLESVANSQLFMFDVTPGRPVDFDRHLEKIRRSLALSLSPRNLQLQRLAFEGALFEAREFGACTYTRAPFDRWNKTSSKALISLGVAARDAELETRILVDAYYGLHFDALLTGDLAGASTVFERALIAFEEHIKTLLAANQSGPVTPG